MSVFQVNGTTPDPGERPYGPETLLHMPPASGKDGNGNPVGAVGYPWFVGHWPIMKVDDYAFWAALIGDDLSVALTSLTVWNQYTNAWQTFTHAVMHQPTFGGIAWRGSAYSDVRVVFSELY